MVSDGIKAAFPSGKRALLVPVGLLAVLIAGGFITGVLGAPHVVGVDNEFGETSQNTTNVTTALVVGNPNPVGVRLGSTSVDYTVAMNGVTLASGGTDDVALEQGNTTLRFATAMQNEKIPAWWVTHVRNDETSTLQLDATVRSSLVDRSVSVPYQKSVETDVIGQFNSTEPRPVNADAPLVSDPVLYVNETSANWGRVTRSETPIRTRMRVYNPKPVPYTVTEVGYEMTMNDVTVGEGTTDRAHVVAPKSSETVEMRTVIRNERLDEWWVSHVENDQVTDLRIEFYARLELPTGETIRVPLRGVDYTKRVETHLFENDSAEGTLEETAGTGDGAGTGDDAGASGDAGATDGTTSDGSDGTRTSGTTDGTVTTDDDGTTASSTTTEGGETTTDDGGLLGATTDDGFLARPSDTGR
ncbi:LEA type 2 family protein [Halomicrococcus gelatinilyticus]|uniref:LEA type 2 family protein n=1 Tax=Halomicrococcus gelatinilyticus TaxID=1702103 RepID=UPI002E139B10